jgi:hypothetical protein
MEAVGEPQHRTRVNPRKASLHGSACRLHATPDIQSWQTGTEDGGDGNVMQSYPGRPSRIRRAAVGRKEETTRAPGAGRSRITA